MSSDGLCAAVEAILFKSTSFLQVDDDMSTVLIGGRQRVLYTCLCYCLLLFTVCGPVVRWGPIPTANGGASSSVSAHI
jgi:hypothetical protein